MGGISILTEGAAAGNGGNRNLMYNYNICLTITNNKKDFLY